MHKKRDQTYHSAGKGGYSHEKATRLDSGKVRGKKGNLCVMDFRAKKKRRLS